MIVLVKRVLDVILLYWLSLSNIPKTILYGMRQIMFKYTWRENKEHGDIPIIRWEDVSNP
jgi:hypothetical protein